MTPTAFIAKWRANARNERAAAQEHFLDLCALLDEPTPNSDPTGAAYAFEKGATKASGGEGWADVWRRGRFAWEYKGKHKDLDAAHRQLLQYAGALENPPLLVTSDIERITIRTNWTNAVSERHEVRLEEMADPARLGVLKSVFADPERLRPGTTRAALTAKAAAEFAELAGRLRNRGNDPQVVAHFVNRLVFCLFADDVGLLPAGLFERMLDAARKRPAQFQGYASRLFAAMAERGGEVDFTPVAWFNGGLFDDGAALPLEADDIALLQRAAALDWAEVDPSILGTLFERGLDPDKRSQLGAHYTSREMIERLIEPVVRRPLLAEWGEVREQIVAALAAGIAAKAGSKAKRDAPRRAETLFRGFLDRLRAFRVLDPACGSGNFLYLALLALKDLEHQAMVEAEAIGLQREFPQVGPEAVLGLEVNPYAAELARVSVWIGHIQWARRHGFPAPSDPVLRTLNTIACRDAVLADDGSQAAWPTGDVIVGNPPFLGGKRMRTVLGDAYCARLFAAYAGQVPAEADLVCYWVARAQEAIAAGKLSRAGLVTTNSIRGGANRRVLEPMAQAGAISTAWADEPWTLDGAAVRVSLVCWGHDQVPAPMLDGVAVPAIHADLTAGAANLTTARRLPENAGVAFMGDTKGGAFDVPGELARQWLLLPSNANGRPNADVLRPWANGMDVTRRPSDTWIIDFGWTMTEAEAAYYAAPYGHVTQHVRPVRAANNRIVYARDWWRHVEARQGMHKALNGLSRFIVTPRVSKHRLFVWMRPPTLADSATIVTARDDDTTFGILHSRFHEVWALRLGTWLGVGNDPRYTPSTTFETFPFPDGLSPDRPAATYADDPRAKAIAHAAQALVTARDRWLNPAELVNRVSEVVVGFPDRMVPRDQAAVITLRGRTLTALYNQRGKPEGAWLDRLHADLDTAVVLKAALESSVYICPLDPGLTYDELVHAAQSADFLEGEIHDGISQAVTLYFGAGGDKIQLDKQDVVLLHVFLGEEDPDYRNRVAFHRVFEAMRYLIREKGVANAFIERTALVEKCVSNQAPAHDVQVAITILTLNEILHVDSKGISFARGKETYGSPGDAGNLQRRSPGQQLMRREARARAYPIVKQIIAARNHPEPISGAAPSTPAEKVLTAITNDEWLSARASLDLLGRNSQNRMGAICRRAHAGLVKARARRFMRDNESVDNIEVPSQFWWAEGNAALEQNWDTGDFETWIDRKTHLRAFGVQFLRSDIESMKGTTSLENTEVSTKIFVGHGRSNAWKDLRDFLRDRLKLTVDEYNVEPTAGIPTTERLEQMLKESKFAFLVMTAEDEQPDGSIRARENVIHEAGLFQGKLGFRKAIVMLEAGCNEFSNIAGLGEIRFPKGNIDNKFDEVRRVLEREGVIKGL